MNAFGHNDPLPVNQRDLVLVGLDPEKDVVEAEVAVDERLVPLTHPAVQLGQPSEVAGCFGNGIAVSMSVIRPPCRGAAGLPYGASIVKCTLGWLDLAGYEYATELTDR